jgi:hypothetical protein
MGSSPSPPGPLTTCGRLRGLPVLAHGVSLHAWGLRLRGAAPRSRYRVCALLPSGPPDAVGSPKRGISELNTQPTDTPVQRFKCDLTIALTWLGARVARYAFPVRLFHSLLHAGLSRRYPGETACPTTEGRCALVGQAVSPAKAHFRTPRSEPRVSKRCPRSDEEVSGEQGAGPAQFGEVRNTVISCAQSLVVVIKADCVLVFSSPSESMVPSFVVR